MPTVQTSEPGMEAAAKEFASKAGEFNGHLRAVNGEMRTLQASWRGDASNSFNHAMDNWEASFQTVINQLLRMMDVMGATTAGYRAAEEDASQTAQAFSSALPGV
nr:WXG100 family type VII secretion target [Micromonospora matsumotoense]